LSEAIAVAGKELEQANVPVNGSVEAAIGVKCGLTDKVVYFG
jgi:hypothetical protein